MIRNDAHSPKDVIFCADARRMAEVAGWQCAQLVVTSPPYNVGKSYDNHNDDLPLDDYLTFLNQVWRECYRVLTPGGRLCINVANTEPQAVSAAQRIDHRRDLADGSHGRPSLVMRGEIIWDKAASAGISTAWGSFASSTNPVLRDMHEYIMVFSKDQFQAAGWRQDRHHRRPVCRLDAQHLAARGASPEQWPVNSDDALRRAASGWRSLDLERRLSRQAQGRTSPRQR